MKPTPINLAEAIIDPFWDNQLSGLKHWSVEPGEAHGLRVTQNWCWALFEWSRKPAGGGAAMRMTRRFDVDCSGYDKLVVSVMAPLGSVVRIEAATDRGIRAMDAEPAGPLKRELALDLGGSAKLESVTLQITPRDEGIATGWFNWVGLQNTALLARHVEQWLRFTPDWEGYLKPEPCEPSFKPTYGLLLDADELDTVRREHEAFVKAGGKSPFLAAGDAAAKLEPEKMVRDFVNFWGDTRYCRERDHGNVLLSNGPVGHGVNAAIAGQLTRDKKLIRLAARYAMALVNCGMWDDGMICRFPGGLFEHRCFVQSLCVHEAALILDLAGDQFTNVGRDLILRRVAEEGIGAINFNTWKHEYIFHCNQLAWFTPGRMLGYLLMEKHWPRVKPYTELAYNDLIESLGYAILPDGGYVEGPTYFRCVGRDGGLSLYYYAKSRGKRLSDVIPERMRKTAGFAAIVASTDDEKDVIPICDAGNRLDHETLSVMAASLPESQWVSIFRKSIARTGGIPGALLAHKLLAEIPARGPAAQPFVMLPEMGVAASTRRLGDAWVKMLIMGNKGGAGHTHEDKGSFVLEFAGQTFALDPGTCDYSSPFAGMYKNCERHSMLLPRGEGITERPAPRCPNPRDVKPVARGDEMAFQAELDVTPGWETYYKRWKRAWCSPSPDVLAITDEWELQPGKGDGVDFLWQTRMPVRIDGQNAVITGSRGTVTITAPPDTTLRVNDLATHDGAPQRCIVIGRRAVAGKMTVNVRLAPANPAGATR